MARTPTQHAILKQLSGGTKRSLGRTNQIVAEILKNTRAFPHLISGLWHQDPVIRMRAADAIEKITLQRRALLRPFKKKILLLAAGSGAASVQQEVRWHLALILPRLELTPTERALAIDILFGYLDDRSIIVKIHALQIPRRPRGNGFESETPPASNTRRHRRNRLRRPTGPRS